MKRPIFVALMGILYIVAGVSGIIYHITDREDGYIVIHVIRLVAIVGGIFVLRGANWARFILVAWIAYHLYLSFYHTSSEVAMHAAVLGLTVVALFNRKANAYFS